MPLLQSSIYSIRLVSPSSLSVFKLYGLSSLVCRISSIPIRFSSRSSCPRHSILVPFPPLRFLILGRLYQRSLPQVNVPRIRPLQFNSFVYLRSFFPPTLPCITLLPRITKSNKRGGGEGRRRGGGGVPLYGAGTAPAGEEYRELYWNTGCSGGHTLEWRKRAEVHDCDRTCVGPQAKSVYGSVISEIFPSQNFEEIFCLFPQFSKKFLSPVKQYLYISFVPILSPDSPHLLQLRFHLGLSY